MTQLGFISYIIAAVFFSFFALLLTTSWRGRLQGGLLLFAVLLSVIWAGVGAYSYTSETVSLKHLLIIEVLRNVAWTAFLWRLLVFTKTVSGKHWVSPVTIAYLALCVITLMAQLSVNVATFLNAFTTIDFRIFSHVVQAVFGLFLVEQLFRNTRLELRWAIKFLCFGLGTLFLYDFVLYTEALLFGRLEPALLEARGFVNALIVPLVAVSAARNPQWSVDIFISRSMVFHTTALMGMGVYLLFMAVVGYYIRDFGGSWGHAGQVVFIVVASLILLLLFYSGKLRARVKVFFNQHFFSYKYDYRKEWLDLNHILSTSNSAQTLKEGCIKGLSDIVESTGGVLWVAREDGTYIVAAELSIHLNHLQVIPADDSLVVFLKARQWVVEIPEYQLTPELYEGLDLKHWYEKCPELWLVVPLMQGAKLFGFIGLTEPRAAREINWEDHDLLKTAGQELANYLALMDTNEALANARQFETYNRLSAFVVHDLKNLVAQLSLVVKNSEKHKHNPEFIEDAMSTLTHSVEKMNRLLRQLRKGKVTVSRRKMDLNDVLEDVVVQQNNSLPKPQFEPYPDEIPITTDVDRLTAVLGHLVQNAQDATGKDGWIKLRLYKRENQAIIEIEDNGSGMDKAFIRERLFKPFDTTKGNAGMGIGVFEARQFAQDHSGSLEVLSTPGQGSKFVLKLLLSDSDLESDNTKREVV
jgi:putative PEP-CTERM system histidine kinase